MKNDSGQSGKKRVVLAAEAKEAALDAAAATLAAIHMAKQVGAEVMPDPCAPGALPLNVRLPVGDILFGAAQLQVEFARKLFELNRKSSTLLRNRLRDRVGAQAPRPALLWQYSACDPTPQPLTFKNTATLSKTFRLRAELAGVDQPFDIAPVTIPAGGSVTIAWTFSPELKPCTYTGHIVVESNGIRIESIPLTVIVTK